MSRLCLAAALTVAKFSTGPAVVMAVVVMAGSSAAHAESSNAQKEVINPAVLIEAMSNALKTLNYEGTFVHVQGSSVKTMHILH